MTKLAKKDYYLETSHAKLSTGETILMLRELKGWTQSQLSKASGIAVPNLSQIENNKLSLGKQRSIALAKALGVHPATLMFPDVPIRRVA